MAPNNPLPENAKGWIVPAAAVLGGAAMGFYADDVADFMLQKIPAFAYRKYVLPTSFIVGGVVLAAAGVKLKTAPKVILLALGTFIAMVGLKFLDADRRPILTQASNVGIVAAHWSGSGYLDRSAVVGVDNVQAMSGTLAADSKLYEVKTLAL